MFKHRTLILKLISCLGSLLRLGSKLCRREVLVSPGGHIWDDLLFGFFCALQWAGLDPARLMSAGLESAGGIWIGEFRDSSFTFAVNFSVAELYLAVFSKAGEKLCLCLVPFSIYCFGTWEKPAGFPKCCQLA